MKLNGVSPGFLLKRIYRLLLNAAFSGICSRHLLKGVAGTLLLPLAASGSVKHDGQMYEFAASNCGFNCTAVVLSSLGKECNSERMRQALAIDPDMIRPTSFGDLLRCFESRGLNCEAQKSVTFDDLLVTLRAGRLGILQLNNANFYHFLVVRLHEGDVLQVDDYPSLGVRYSFAEARARLEAAMTGKVLYVSREALPGGKLAKRDTLGQITRINADETRVPRQPLAQDTPDGLNAFQEGASVKAPVGIDLALDPKNKERLSGVIKLENLANYAIKVISLKGACSCFLGWEGPNEIPANGSIELAVQVEKAKLPKGNFLLSGGGESSVAIQTSDEKLPLFQVRLTYRPPQSLLVAVPEKIDFGAVNGDPHNGDVVYVVVAVGKDRYVNAMPKIETRFDTNKVRCEQVVASPPDTFPAHVELARYKVQSTRLLGDEKPELIEIVVGAPYLETLKVQLIGRSTVGR